MKIAIYKSIEFGSTTVFEASDYMEGLSDYARTTNIVDAEFVERQKIEVIESEISFIDKRIKKEMADSESRLNQLKQRKQELLALPDMSEE